MLVVPKLVHMSWIRTSDYRYASTEALQVMNREFTASLRDFVVVF